MTGQPRDRVVRDHTHLRAALRRRREQLGLTPAEVAERARVGRVTVVDFEAGTKNTWVDTVFRIAHALGYDLAVAPREDRC